MLAEMSKLLAFLILTSTVCAGICCPDGTVASTSNDECWLFVAEPQDFVFAQKHCQDQGGNLTSIHNKFDNILFADIAKNVLKDSESVITGGNNLINRNSWTWINGDVFDFSAWADYEPANVDTNNCLHIEASTGFWHAKDCRVKAPFVCSIVFVTLTTANSDQTSTAENNTTTATTADPNFPAPSIGTSQGYLEASEYFASVLNPKVDPCEDFYSYTCGAYDQAQPLAVLQLDMIGLFAKAASKPNDDTAPLPVQLVKKQFAECVNQGQVVEDGSIITDIFDKFQSKTGFKFPLMDNSTADWPNPENLGIALGYMHTILGVPTVVTMGIYQNSKYRKGQNAYRIMLQSPTLSRDVKYFIGEPLDTTIKSMSAEVKQLLLSYAAFKKIPVDPVQLDSDVKAIIEFEILLADNYTGHGGDSSFSKAYNLINNQNFTDTYKFFDLNKYFANLAVYAPDAGQKMTAGDFLFLLAEPEMMAKLDKAFTSSFDGLVEARTFYNYLFYRILASASSHLPPTTSPRANVGEVEQLINVKFAGESKSADAASTSRANDQRSELLCAAEMLTKSLDAAANRLFVDYLYPTRDSQNKVQQEVRDMANRIINGVRSMIDGLTWLTPASKQAAYDKLDKITTNIVSEEWWFDDQALTEEYAHVHNFLNETSYHKIQRDIFEFRSRIEFEKLLKKDPLNKTTVQQLAFYTNAWYHSMTNSMTFSAGILKSPMYNPEFPRSVIYGSIGGITGHELFHGFDPLGVQFDGEGLLNPWLDEESQRSFENMTDCLVAQYSEFCPLDAAQYSPHCLNGKYTLAENLADNAGIRAAYRAYKNSVAFNGEDPRLPGPLMSQFNHDQLFFLSFSRMWCESATNPDQTYQSIITDPHSPSKYRVLGTLQNYPAFRNAFNCPANSAYAPKEHCNVWISDANRI